MYSGEYDACDVTLSVYPHRASLKNMPDHGGNRNQTAKPETRPRNQTAKPDRVAQLAEHWASIPKVVGSIPTVVRHIFQACPVWIYTQSNITSIRFLCIQQLLAYIFQTLIYHKVLVNNWPTPNAGSRYASITFCHGNTIILN